MMDESPKSGMSSPEARLGMRVEDLWDVQEPQLSPTEKLNACFESIPVSSFPPAPSSQVIEIRSDASLAEAVRLLAQHRILSAPVVDVDAPDDASWIDRYIGIVEFAGIVAWILHQVGDISGTFRWAPFLALQKSNSFLTMLLLLSKYRMKSIPVVDPGEQKIDNIITQSAVIHMLEECAGLHWFENWGTRQLSELGLPLMKPSRMLKIYEDDQVLLAFKLMREKGIGGVPVVESDGRKAIGNISIRDIQFLLTAPEIYKNYRSITAKNFLTAVRSYLEEHHQTSPLLNGMVTCRRENTIKEVIVMLDSKKIHRIYVVDDEGNLEGVVTLRDIISKLVHEPRGYFGDFFDGVLPLPQNSRV